MIRSAAILLAILIGIAFVASRLVEPRWVPITTLIVLAVTARLPWVNATGAKVLEACRSPSRAALAWSTAAVAITSAAYLLGTALYQHRELFPRLHDEHCYIIQSRMMLTGRLWMPRHPVADFFDNFYILSKPVYAPIYFPGTALLNVPFVALDLPSWSMPLLVTSVGIALTYHIVTLLIDGVAGLIAAMVAIGTWGLREFSTVVMAQAPMTLLGLLIVWGWLAWRRDRRVWRAALLGAFMGWAAITRPVDALAFAIPVLIAMAFDLRAASMRTRVFTVGMLVLAAIPFLSLQVALNKGTTGHATVSPYTTYLKHDQPGSEYGFHPFRPELHPDSVLPQKRLYFEKFRLDEIRNHTLARLPLEAVRRMGWTLYCLLPAGILGILLPASLFGLTDRRRWVFLGAAVLFVALYLPNPFFLVHYPVPFGPVMAFLIALAVDVLSRGRQGRPANATTSAFLTLIVLGVCISALPEFRRDVRDGTVPAMPLMSLLHNQLASEVKAPAVVLFRFDPKDNPVEDPVYNDDVAWPDDAPIIRAHDLGSRDIEIARYYAQTQPGRHFYLLDRQENLGRSTLLLHPLGTTGQFVKSLEARASSPN